MYDGLDPAAGITALPLLAWLDLVHAPPPDRRRRSRAAALLRAAALAAAAAGLLQARLALNGGATPAFTRHNNPAAFEPDRLRRWAGYWHAYTVSAALVLRGAGGGGGRKK